MFLYRWRRFRYQSRRHRRQATVDQEQMRHDILPALNQILTTNSNSKQGDSAFFPDDLLISKAFVVQA
ncbi:unnamed protein product [Didymodactylos carnosus]|uniref:Uncharacterized protein n=2 Tax=Didymodactylos carnosus TaxID=1234261 RepID=A0A816ENV1_9BILA|nr:unnamed protein product [Didymodactylos carnosus]CAF4582318.1 unnamed protein product [Didymodactylos carnosus]